MTTMQAAVCAQALVERSEHQGEHDNEGAMETSDRVCKRIRVLFDRSGNPGVGQLQQQRAACT
jgi:hypothetical protein